MRVICVYWGEDRFWNDTTHRCPVVPKISNKTAGIQPDQKSALDKKDSTWMTEEVKNNQGK
jgi:hypothetical protein